VARLLAEKRGGGPFFYSVEHFSVKVFTEENTTVLAGRWVKVGEGWEGGGGGGLVVSTR